MKHFHKSDSRLHRGRKLDVSLQADPRNENYRMQTIIPSELPTLTKEWDCPEIFDQGREGKCVAYAGIHWFGSGPLIQKVSHHIADLFYTGAQRRDKWAGEDYEGTSVTGLMRYLRAQGHIGEYRWIDNLAALQLTISQYGPVIVGCQWREGCFDPDREGFITFTGAVKGGHATEWRGVDMEQGFITIQQSWGVNHGINGSVKMRFPEVQKLLNTRPQIAFPTKKPLTISTPKRPWWQFWK